MDISRGTLQPYIRDANPKIFAPKTRGRRCILNTATQDTIIKAVQNGNNPTAGDARKDAILRILAIQPDITPKQARDIWDKTMHPRGVASGMLTGADLSLPCPHSLSPFTGVPFR
jgi:hypothetical protein